MRVQVQDEHEMRTSSYLGQIPKRAYVVMGRTEEVNKGDSR